MTQDLSGFFRGFLTGVLLSVLTALVLTLIFPSFVFRDPVLTKETSYVAAFPITPDVMGPVAWPDATKWPGILAAGAPAPLIDPGQGPERSPADQMSSTVNLSASKPVTVDFNSPSLFVPNSNRLPD